MVRTNGRVYGHVITKTFWMDGLPNFLRYGLRSRALRMERLVQCTDTRKKSNVVKYAPKKQNLVSRKHTKKRRTAESFHNVAFFKLLLSDTPGGGVLAEKLGRGVRPASQNPYPIYDQNLRFSLPYL